MLTISRQAALNRWDKLSETLRFSLFAEENTEFIEKTCAAEHIPPEKAPDVAGIAGYVLLGFLHPEDLAGELKDELNLDPKICSSIADAINSRIFVPLRQEIDRIYEPLSKFAVASADPKIIQDIGPATPSAKPRSPASISVNVIPTAPLVPTAKPNLSDVGWSRATVGQPVVKLSQTVPQIPAMTAPAPMAPKEAVGEFQRLSMKGVPIPAAPAPEPAPVILHENASFKPQQRAPDFHLDLPAEKFSTQKGVTAAPVRAAVLELGKAAPPPAPKPVTSTPRVVHYTEYKSSSPENPTPPSTMAATAQRKITEITSGPPLPKPPAPPSTPKLLPAEPAAPPLPPPPKPSVPIPPPPPPQRK